MQTLVHTLDTLSEIVGLADLAKKELKTELAATLDKITEREEALEQKMGDWKDTQTRERDVFETEKQAWKEERSILKKITESKAALEQEIHYWKDTQNRERAVIETEKQAWEEEKAAIGTMAPKLMDVVSLNVGGRLHSIKRATLCQRKRSLLASMFSGRWEDSLERDENNRIFLEIDPDCFELIVKWLRLLRIDPDTEFPHIPSNLETDMQKWIDYLGLFVPIPTLEWREDEDFVISEKSITRRYFSGVATVFVGFAWNKIVDIPSKVEFVCMCAKNSGLLIIGFCLHQPPTRKQQQPCLRCNDKVIKLERIQDGDCVTIAVHHSARTFSVALNGSLVSSTPKFIDIPCELSIEIIRGCQGLTLI